jgi:hypothetical protein
MVSSPCCDRFAVSVTCTTSVTRIPPHTVHRGFYASITCHSTALLAQIFQSYTPLVVRKSQKPCTQSTAIMDGFEDDNPFDNDADRVSSETSSASKVDLSEPVSPIPAQRNLPPTSPQPSRPFPSPGPTRQAAQPQDKTDFCCQRDRVLHSGEDIEILVCWNYNDGVANLN